MAKVPKPTDYASLRKIWYKKLKTSKSKLYPDGFSDIETMSGKLKGHSEFTRPRATWQAGGFAAKAEYTRLAELFLIEYEFESKIEKVIWEYHTNGISIRDIAVTLKKARVKGTFSRNTIHPVIKRLRNAMKKKYIK